MKKKLLAILVAVCLVVALVPATVFAAFVNPYTDVASDAWYYDEVMCVTERGLMTHTGDKAFEPATYTTRGMLMTILARMAGVDTTGSNPWYKTGMEWAVAQGVSDGTNPTDLITREQIVTMLYRYENSPYASVSLTGFVDSDNVSDWAQAAVEWAVYVGLLEGKDGGILDPTGAATRAELAAILCRHAHLYEGTGGGSGHRHKWGEWESNGDGTHTRTCTKNSKHTQTKDCTYVDGVCKDCGAEVPCEHVNTEYVINEDGTHHTICSDCEAVLTESETHEYVDGVCVCGDELTEKFSASVTAGASATVTVYSDYSAEIVLPAADLDPTNVTVSVSMTDVASLGVTGTKSESFTMSDIPLNGSPSLADWLSSAWEFTTGDIDVTVIDGDKTENVVYTLTGNGAEVDGGDVTITATADTEDARAAWQLLTSNVETDTATDSSVLVKKGSYIQIGGEKLIVGDVTDDLVLDDLNGMNETNTLKKTITDAVKVIKVGDDSIELFAAAGCTLAVGQTSAVLTKDALITVDGLSEDAMTELNGVLGMVRDYANAGEYMFVMRNLVTMLDEILGTVNGSTISVVIEFTEPVAEEEITEKLSATLTAGASATVTVYSDYSAEVVLPAADLDPSSITVSLSMTDVASLGVTGTKSETFTMSDIPLTGSPSLADWLDSAWEFTQGYVDVTIKDDTDSKRVVYTLTGTELENGDMGITAIADTQDAREAWALLTSHVATDSAESSYVLVKNGSYIQIGGEQLIVGDVADDLVLDNLNGLNDSNTLKQTIKDAVKVVAVDDDSIVIFGTAESTLAVGQSSAVLADDVTITISGLSEDALYELEGVLGTVRDWANAGEYMGVMQYLVKALNEILGTVNGSTLYVTIEF